MIKKIIKWFRSLSINKTKKKLLSLLEKVDYDRDGIVEGVKKEISDIIKEKILTESNIERSAFYITEYVMRIITKKIDEVE